MGSTHQRTRSRIHQTAQKQYVFPAQPFHSNFLFCTVLTKCEERAIDEIRHYQNTTGLVCSTKAFGRIFQDVLYEMGLEDPEHDQSTVKTIRVGKKTIKLLQEVSEQFLVSEFQSAVLSQLHAERLTLQGKDMKHVRDLRDREKGFRVCYNERSKESRAALLRKLYAEKKNKRGKYTVEKEEKRAREQIARRKRHLRKLANAHEPTEVEKDAAYLAKIQEEAALEDEMEE